jgi:tetratricopeptide (TPR) repeat protein
MMTALADQALEALDVAVSDPGKAAGLASAVIVRARTAGDHAAWSIAERVLGLAAKRNEDLDAAIGHLREAISHGRRSGSRQLTAQARMTMAFVQTARGRSRRGLQEIDAALLDLEGLDRARGEAQRGAILLQLGRLEEALSCYDRTLPVLRAAGDSMWIWRVLSNRAVAYGRRLELAAAEADLRAAAALGEQLKLVNSTAYVLQNQGWIAALAGDVPTALAHLDEAEQRLRALDWQIGEVLCDRAEVLLSVHLTAEARQAASDGVAALEREHWLNILPEARLLLARAASLDGDPALAVAQARRAAGEFRRQGRSDWLALARLAVLTSRLAASPRPRVTLRSVAEVAETLTAAGWTAPAIDARVLAGLLARERGRTAEASRHWQQASRHRTRGPATVQARAWYAMALARWADGNGRGAISAVRAGLRVVDEYRATMGATDLRARAAGHRTELAQLGLSIALAGGRARTVLEWAERGRASMLRIASVRPPDDGVLRAALVDLRAAVAEVDRLGGAGSATPRALARQMALELRVRDAFRRLPSAGELVAEPVTPDRLAARLDGAVLVEFVEHDQDLYAVTVTGRAVRLRRLTASSKVYQLLDRIPFALRRMGRTRSTAQSREAATAALRDAAARLDAALLRPLAADLADAPLVLVPTGRLQSMAWSILPSCTGRSVVVAPSATAWYQASTAAPADRGGISVVAGPHLPGAEHEAIRVAAIHDSQPLLGASATVDATLRALQHNDLVHLAAHGRLSAENPLFSSLRLADGPLMVYDLEGLHRVPSTVVLAACDSGRHVVCAGDELLGLAATFLARGTRQLVGSIITVPDLETGPLMIEFHRLVAAGRSTAQALAQVQHAAIGEGGAVLAAAAGFVCVGAGLGMHRAPAGAVGTSADLLAGAPA